MSFNGNGTFQLSAGNPVVTGTVISSTVQNNTMSDIANNGLSNCITKDGQQTVTANIPFNNNRLISVGAGVASSDAATVGQIQSGASITLTGLSGTGDAIVANTAPAITAYTAGQEFIYIPTSTNTLTNPTINISTVGAKTITQSNGNGLWSGALAVGTPYVLLYDGTNFRVTAGQLGNLLIQQSSQTGSRNRIIDGNFDFWSSGTSFNLSGGTSNYTADMWYCSGGTGGSAAATISRGSFTPGSEPALATTPCVNFLGFTQTAAASALAPYIAHRTEGVQSLEGRSATLSVWMIAPSTVSITNVQISQVFGTGGSATVVTNVPVTWTVTSTWQRFSVRIDVPSISGKTVGTRPFLQTAVVLPLNLTFTVNTFQWQLEDCPAGAPSSGLPTPFEWRSYAPEKLMVGRYYQQQMLSARFFASAATQFSDNSISFVPSMGGSPAASLVTAGTRANVGTPAVPTVSPQGARFEITSSAAGDAYAINDIWQFDSRF